MTPGTTVPIKSVLLFLLADEESETERVTLLREGGRRGNFHWPLFASGKLILSLFFLPKVLVIRPHVGITMVRSKEQKY